MTITSFRSNEPLYIVIVRDAQAEKLLKQWAANSACKVTVEGNRMKIFEQRNLDRFHIEWPHSWHNVTIWDCWHRRHIYND